MWIEIAMGLLGVVAGIFAMTYSVYIVWGCSIFAGFAFSKALYDKLKVGGHIRKRRVIYSTALFLLLMAVFSCILWFLPADPHTAGTFPSQTKGLPPSLPPMPSLLSLFMTDFRGKNSGGGLGLNLDGFAELTFDPSAKLRIFYTVIEDYGSQSKFVSFYIPQSSSAYEAIKFLATGYKEYLEVPLLAEVGSAHSLSVTKSSDLLFTRRIFIYHENHLTLSQLGELNTLYEKENIRPEFRSSPYALAVWESIRSGSVKPPPKYEIKDGLPRAM